MTDRVDQVTAIEAWAAVHGAQTKWLLACLAAWASLVVFATVTIPLKYPFEAHGEVVDSGAVIGLLIPLVITALALDEGPADLVLMASRRLLLSRLAAATTYLVVAVLGGWLLALIAGLPEELIATDAAAAGAAVLGGTAVLGTRWGWAPAAAAATVLCAPGIVPWEYDAIFHRTVSSAFVLVAGGLALGAAAAYGRWGSIGLRARSGVSKRRVGASARQIVIVIRRGRDAR